MSSSSNQSFNASEYEQRTRLPREEIIEIKQAFDIFDTDGSGSIDPKELREAFEELGWKGNSKFIYRILEEIDDDFSGGIGFDEFLKIATAKVTDRDSKKETDKVFRMFDSSENSQAKKGYITVADLKRVSVELGEELTDDEIQDMFNRADADQDGKVTDTDIHNIMTGKFYWDNHFARSKLQQQQPQKPTQ